MDTESTEVAVKALECEPVKNLLGPVTTELGLALGDLGGVVRFYTTENLKRIFPKWAHQHQSGQPLTVEQVGRVIPLLQAASLQADDELQERWAALLESTVTDERGMLPSFGQTLAQLTADEARYLSALQSHAASRESGDGRWLGQFANLQSVYNELMQGTRVTRVTPARLIVQDFERLGLLVCKPYEADFRIGSNGPMQLTPSTLGLDYIDVYSISEYGACFIEAVTPKQSDREV